ncbi:MAG: flagellar protein [Ignavibacteriaceae bacterium]|nr:flagellar protein [Ignavibacteriaceae bacterium]
MPEINGINVPFIPISNPNLGSAPVRESGDSFNAIYQKELDKLKFSSHAIKRLEERKITLNNDEMLKINSAIERAETKGAKDSLVMMNSTAFIVNIPNKTIVTAMPIDNGTENIFTNIDSVVFAV